MLTKTLLASALISAASAHQVLQQLWINNETPGLNAGIRVASNNSPIPGIQNDAMACNILRDNSATVTTLEAKAGDSIKVQWSALIHIAPITHFLKPVKDAATDSGVGEGWFKIDELDFVNGQWASDVMRANNLTHEFKLPDGLPSGEYLLRSEMVALHLAETAGGAEFYVGCAQLKVTGADSGKCGPTIAIPGSYNANDKSLLIPNKDDPSTKEATFNAYKAPGGEIASCGGSEGSPVPTAPSTPQPITSTVAVVPSPITSPSPVVEATPQPAPAEPVASGEAPVSSPIAPQSDPVASIPVPAPAAGNGGSADVLPASFSLDTFISWIKSKFPGSKARRHARAF